MSAFDNTPDNVAKMMEVAEYLLGTCNSLEEGLASKFGEDNTDLVDFDIELLRALDSQVMCCEGCNWWCETHELNEDQVCDDCAPAEDET